MNSHTHTSLSVELVRNLGARERRAYSSQGISMRVDKVAQDGRTLICTVFQHRKAPLARPMDTVRLVMLAESALAPLLTAGYTPMITAVDWEHAQMLRNSHDRPDPHDPIGLISALREEGLPFPRMQVEEREGTPALVALPLWRRALGFFA